MSNSHVTKSIGGGANQKTAAAINAVAVKAAIRALNRAAKKAGVEIEYSFNINVTVTGAR